MKKKLAKSIIAATLALTSVLAFPQFKAPTAKDNCIISVHAAGCTHNYRHYYTYGEWHDGTLHVYIPEGTGSIPFKWRYRYTTCINCGYQEYTGKEIKY